MIDVWRRSHVSAPLIAMPVGGEVQCLQDCDVQLGIIHSLTPRPSHPRLRRLSYIRPLQATTFSE
jgi:hypothetical protein